MSIRKIVPLLLVVVLALGACAPAAEVVETEAPEAPVPTATAAQEATTESEVMEKDIVDIAAEDGRFTTLVAAVQAAGLVDALKGEGPLTVFAPTDEAFAALPEGTLEALLADIPALTDILLYHVVDGKLMTAGVVGLSEAMTLQGSAAPINVQDGAVYIAGAQVILTDIEASNGVIHVIDSVIIPE
ncbi:MAG: fasciclin domain-containing protein [Anaerolineales bacterium]